MNIIIKLTRLLKFYFKAKTYKDFDNSNVSQLIYNILELNDSHYRITEIENIRKTLKRDSRTINIRDLGAGSTFSKENIRSIKSIANSALSPKWQCHLLYKTINEFMPENILELGTSLGISTSYLAIGNPSSTVTTLEGSEAVASIAMENFAKLRLKNIKLVYGDFDNTLPILLKNMKEIDFAFIDGNHKKEATIKYFQQILKKSTNHTIMVFDDIHWSKGMENAWEEIKKSDSIKLTLDFFSFGIILFDKRFGSGNHYSVIERKFKLWK